VDPAERGEGARQSTRTSSTWWRCSDVPLDQTFIGLMGFDQFRRARTNFPINDSALHDGIGILQWEATRLRVGESIRLNMYYDASACAPTSAGSSTNRPACARPTSRSPATQRPSKQPAPTQDLIRGRAASAGSTVRWFVR